MNTHARLVAAALLLVTWTHDLQADPVRIGEGSAFTVTDFRNPDGTFSNVGVFILPPDITTGIFGLEIFANARSGCQPCHPGDPLNLSGSFELRGPRYLSAGDEFAVYGLGTLNFTAETAIVPASTDDSIAVMTPFGFEGFVSLYRVPGDVLIFQSEVFGQGLTRAFLYTLQAHDFVHGGDGVDGTDTAARVFHQQEYRFGDEPSPEPIPEPATIVLCASGLAVMLRRRRRTAR